MKQPSLYLPHGGGPCFFMDWDPPDTWRALERFLRSIPTLLPQRPRALLVVTAHWLAPQFRSSGAAQPALIYDYSGFPPHTYRLRYDAPGDPALAERVRALLAAAGEPAQVDAEHGWDHGVFVPLKLMFPDADVPVVALSLRRDLDPAAHLAAGRALAPLRDEGVLIVGSGMSFHNLRAMMDPRYTGSAEAFDRWLLETLTAQRGAARAQALAAWEAAPEARAAHPHEDHLLPLMVAAGAGFDEAGTRIYADRVLGQALSAYRFG